MNLVMASVLLLAMLAFQPTLIYGARNLAAASARTESNSNSNSATGTSNTGRKAKSTKYGKRHSAEALHPLYSPALSSASKLVLSMESGDVLVRAARGAAVDNKQTPTGVVAGGSNGGKRQKTGNTKKLNKNLATHENGSTSSSSSSSSGAGAAAAAGASTTSATGRKHLEKKFSATSGLSSAQQPANNKGKQRQMLKSQNHQGKRSGNNGGNKAIRENGEMLQGEGEKTPGCRYAKSVWTECDAKTNMRSRTLSLKKGDASCQQTRIMQKKCKKSCRFEKGAWSECINGQMTREDKLKATGGSESSSCEAVRSINRKCNPNNGGGASKQGSGGGGKKERKNKDKGSRRNQGQQQQQQQQQEQQQQP